MRSGRVLGDYPAMAYVRLGHPETGDMTGAMADTGSPRTIIDRLLAARAGAVATGRTGTMKIAGRSLRGVMMRVRVTALDGPCTAEVEAFMPTSRTFRKGLLLGMDVFQSSKMQIDGASGEAYCPMRRRRADH